MTAAAVPEPASGRVQTRTLAVLVASQVLGGVGVALAIAVGSLLAVQLSGSDALAGLAQTGTVLGAAVVAVPLARLSTARGRRVGLGLGYALGALGAVLVVVSSVLDQFPLMLVGSTVLGAATASGLQARYAATDLAAPETRGRALSIVVWATTIGVVLGPNLIDAAGRSARLFGLPEFAGAYVWSLTTFVGAGAVVFLLLRPDPLLLAASLRSSRTDPVAVPSGATAPAAGLVQTDSGPVAPAAKAASLAQSLRIVRRFPSAVLAIVAVAVAHTVMVGVMVMTPVHLDHGGATLRVIGLVISAHVAGMYALSPLVGWLADRIGRVPVIALGAVLLVAALVVAGTSDSHAAGRLGIGLFLLGLGWSCALVAGSTLLTESVPAPSRPGVQGAADLVMGLCGATGGALAGVIFGVAGYGWLNVASAGLLVPLVLLMALRRR